MKLDLPRVTERFGSISFHGVQRVFELDSGSDEPSISSEAIKIVGNSEIAEIEKKMAIVIPIKSERLKLVEGVLSGIPHDCMTILVSNSPRTPVDRYKQEKEALEQFNRFANKNAMIVHQKDENLAEVLKEVGYNDLIGPDGLVRNGKAEGMILGLLLAKMEGKEYVGFIDGDNYIPGAVNEYVKIFSSGIAMSNSPYTMVRISWIYKPKVSEAGIYFSKWGRVSEITNNYLNALISHYTGFESEVIRTGNSGEHCMSIKLAELLLYSSGFSVEAYEIVNLLELFGGITPPIHTDAMECGVEVMQIETRNPHFHEDKGDEHLKEMIHESLACIYNSDICQPKIREKMLEELRLKGILNPEEMPSQLKKISPFKDIDINKIKELLSQRKTNFTVSGYLNNNS